MARIDRMGAHPSPEAAKKPDLTHPATCRVLTAGMRSSYSAQRGKRRETGVSARRILLGEDIGAWHRADLAGYGCPIAPSRSSELRPWPVSRYQRAAS
jgi:hypothetical protein